MYSAAKEITGKKKSEKKRRVGRTKRQENVPDGRVCLFIIRVAVAARVDPIPRQGGGTSCLTQLIVVLRGERYNLKEEE